MGKCDACDRYVSYDKDMGVEGCESYGAITSIKNCRFDLSDWIIHFVHDRKSADDLYIIADYAKSELDEDYNIISFFNEEGKGVSLSDEYREKEYPIAEDEPAFGVLKKIIHDGYIHSGWSLRHFRPTIYGPYSATCFTEMPLHALIKYAKFRGTCSGYVGNYGIAFKRSELYNAGARPVIYGLSSPHQEANDESDPNFGHGWRCLSSKCGIGLNEQYRYVYTNFGTTKSTDWMHEREWRWPLSKPDSHLDGMPFLLSEDWGYQFSEIVIIVSKDVEQQEILEQLKVMYDAKGRECGIDYNIRLISATKVLSLESLETANINLNDVRIEDVPMMQIPVKTTIPVRDEVRQKVINAVAEAHNVFNRAVDDYLAAHPDYVTPEFNFGTAWVHTYEVSEVTQAMVNENLIASYGDGKYSMHVGRPICDDLDLEIIGAEAAAEYLKKELGQQFYTHFFYD